MIKSFLTEKKGDTLTRPFSSSGGGTRTNVKRCKSQALPLSSSKCMRLFRGLRRLTAA